MPDIDLTLTLMPEPLAVCRLDPEQPVPSWAVAGEFFSVTRTPKELSVVCAERQLPAEAAADMRVERSFQAFRVEGPLAFSQTGILAGLLEPLARESIPAFALSTYDTDYILVQRPNIERSVRALERKCRVRRA